MTIAIDAARLIERIKELGAIGRDEAGRLCRVAGTDADREGRDLLCEWLKQAGLRIEVDRIGNIYGIWEPEDASGEPVVMGSHIDTVIDAGIYDGCFGVLAGLAVIEAMQQASLRPARPLAVVAYTNEEGVRFAPDMMGSLVAAGGLATDDALAAIGTDGTTLGAELARIGYAGSREPGFLRPHAYVELHIEQGPVLEAEGLPIGAVENLQGISWQRVSIAGTANHAGTTPMVMRRDAGVAAGRAIAFLDDLARRTRDAVATVGTIRFEPNAINVIPSAAVFTVDLRNPDEDRLRSQEAALQRFLDGLVTEGYEVRTERLARFEPVIFAPEIVSAVEESAGQRQLPCRRMTSGAGHDAQMIARVAPAAMIFVPSKGGISHNPAEFTADHELIAGANVLLDVTRKLSQ
ncbi:Zn-dependent hydrolase [Bradyrhizobium neotropicale]|uniref:Allantoate amidohydrolase n=1 Tax=Bradyrhizobium neotropicale TaxID=1497615 RepID=A0A176ZHK8_9BRAD|nr:Zn-dependent hydrolase [Bradyrhizobium neotropicale]OAF20140.1 allantoate amidohydrolase [Bradyrhizobium neotropicale]